MRSHSAAARGPLVPLDSALFKLFHVLAEGRASQRIFPSSRLPVVLCSSRLVLVSSLSLVAGVDSDDVVGGDAFFGVGVEQHEVAADVVEAFWDGAAAAGDERGDAGV